MTKASFYLKHTAAGAVTAAVILLSTILAARQVLGSTLFLQSRFVTTILSQDSISLAGVLTEPNKLDAGVKFLGAVTTAYINFEMIPVNEAKTFTVIFECLGDDITIESFHYQGKTLAISGEAPDTDSYEAFREALKEKDYFQSIRAHEYITVEDRVRFDLECGL